MRSAVLLLALVCLPFASPADVSCSAGATKTSGCSMCVNADANSDCSYCQQNFFKLDAKNCKECPDGTYRPTPSAATGIETADVCLKCPPQLNCKHCGDDSIYECDSCPTGMFRESRGTLFGGKYDSARGCSKDCQMFAKQRLSFLPKDETPANTNCVTCSYKCKKCDFAPATMKNCDNDICAPGANKQLTNCTECEEGYYLLANKNVLVPGDCRECGANCKKCKDATECTECMSGWSKNGSEKDGCTKETPVASESHVLKFLTASLVALIVAF